MPVGVLPGVRPAGRHPGHGVVGVVPDRGGAVCFRRRRRCRGRTPSRGRRPAPPRPRRPGAGRGVLRRAKSAGRVTGANGSVTMASVPFHPMVPGATLPGDWFPGRIPNNLVVGQNVMIDSSFCFKHFYATAPVGLRVGSHVTFWRTAVSVEPGGFMEVGDYVYLANAVLVCASRITIGSRVMVSGGVTIADSDFHPLEPAARLGDAIALSPVGDRRRRPAVESRPVVIEDDVWIGFNATILKGVRVGAGAVIEPGAIVSRDVPRGAAVTGNPARVVEAA